MSKISLDKIDMNGKNIRLSSESLEALHTVAKGTDFLYLEEKLGDKFSEGEIRSFNGALSELVNQVSTQKDSVLDPMSKHCSFLETMIGDMYLKELKTEKEIDAITKFLESLVHIYSYNARNNLRTKNK